MNHSIATQETRNKLIDQIENILQDIGKGIAKEQPDADTVVVKATRFIHKIDSATTNFYAYGGWFMIEDNIEWVSYINNTGKLKLDLDMIREEFDIDE